MSLPLALLGYSFVSWHIDLTIECYDERFKVGAVISTIQE